MLSSLPSAHGQLSKKKMQKLFAEGLHWLAADCSIPDSLHTLYYPSKKR